MNKRIRYVKTENPEVLVSKQVFIHPTDGGQYQVQLHSGELEYKVLETLTNKLVASGKAVNLHQVKLKAKQKLMSLGIAFEAEERNTEELPKEQVQE